jgi:DNA-binding MarR family transcriptional regulator
MGDSSTSLRDRVLAMGSSCYALQARRTANQVARTYNRALAHLNVEVAQFSTLCVIAAEQALSVSEMAEQLGVERSTLVRNLKILERDDLIRQAGRDGRRIVYRITAKGSRLLSKALPIWHQIQAELGEAMGGVDGEPHRALRTLRNAARRAASATPET